MTKDEILKRHEDDNEYHFNQVDREWIMEAMQEYADQQLRLYNVSDCSEQWHVLSVNMGDAKCSKCGKKLTELNYS